MAWRSSGTTNDEMVDNLKRRYCIVRNSRSFGVFSSDARESRKVSGLIVKKNSVCSVCNLVIATCNQKVGSMPSL